MLSGISAGAIMGSRGASDDNKKILRRGTQTIPSSVLLALTIVAASRVSLAASQAAGMYLQVSHVHSDVIDCIRYSAVVVAI